MTPYLSVRRSQVYRQAKLTRYVLRGTSRLEAEEGLLEVNMITFLEFTDSKQHHMNFFLLSPLSRIHTGIDVKTVVRTYSGVRRERRERVYYISIFVLISFTFVHLLSPVAEFHYLTCFTFHPGSSPLSVRTTIATFEQLITTVGPASG